MSRFKVGDIVRVKPDSFLSKLGERKKYSGKTGQIVDGAYYNESGRWLYAVSFNRYMLWTEASLELVVDFGGKSFENAEDFI